MQYLTFRKNRIVWVFMYLKSTTAETSNDCVLPITVIRACVVFILSIDNNIVIHILTWFISDGQFNYDTSGFVLLSPFNCQYSAKISQANAFSNPSIQSVNTLAMVLQISNINTWQYYTNVYLTFLRMTYLER